MLQGSFTIMHWTPLHMHTYHHLLPLSRFLLLLPSSSLNMHEMWNNFQDAAAAAKSVLKVEVGNCMNRPKMQYSAFLFTEQLRMQQTPTCD